MPRHVEGLLVLYAAAADEQLVHLGVQGGGGGGGDRAGPGVQVAGGELQEHLLALLAVQGAGGGGGGPGGGGGGRPQRQVRLAEGGQGARGRGPA